MNFIKLPKKNDNCGLPVRSLLARCAQARTQTGFTLIEILVVIGIIAVLAAIVLIAINPVRQFQQARDTQRTSNANAILNAVGQFIADYQGRIPAGITNSVTEIGSALCTDIVPTYMPALTTDPSSNNNGGSVEAADCGSLGTGDVKYTVVQDGTTQRITVSAPDAELSTISITR